MKMCDCKDKIRDEIKKSMNAEYVAFSLSNIVSIADAKSSIISTAQEIEIRYTHTKKNGETMTKFRKSFVTHTYCPFCGVKYE